MVKKRESSLVKKSKYVPVWVPEYIYISLRRNADLKGQSITTLLLQAWTLFTTDNEEIKVMDLKINGSPQIRKNDD